MNEAITLKTRREFLRGTLLGGAVSWTLPAFLARTISSLQLEAAESAVQTATGKDSPILVVLQLAGGNDGLNTVVPWANDFYRKARPTLGIAESKVMKLTDELGLHPALGPFRELFDAGQLSIVQGVGYPNPNRSHFRSAEIWQTASDSNRNEKYGWIGRYFDNACRGADPTVGVNVGRQMPQAFAAARPMGVSLDNPENYRFTSADASGEAEMGASEQFYRQLNRPERMEEGGADLTAGASIGSLHGSMAQGGSALDYLERTALDAQVSSDKIMAISKKGTNMATYPAGQLANSLKLVARLIAGGLSTRVFYVSQGGFDTHTNQSGAHERLLGEMAQAVKAFVDDLKGQGNADRALVMTFSEFGRRVAQNASGGTDHGAAAPMLLIGSKVKAPLAGKFPSLAPGDLQNGDLRFTTDFRSVYAGVLEGWLKTPSAPILGRQFEPLFCV